MRLRVAPQASYSGSLRIDHPGFPGFSLLRPRLMDHRVTPAIAPSGCTASASSGFPESCIYGWVDDGSRSSRTLHPRFTPRMNLRIQSGFTLPAPTLDAFIQSHSGFPPAGEPACVLPTSTASCIVLSGWNYNSNSLLAHQLERSLGLVNLWKQVQNHL